MILELDVELAENPLLPGAFGNQPKFTGPVPTKYTAKYSDDMTRCWVVVIEE